MDEDREDAGAQDDLRTLYGRPGFLIRRAHQISVSLFVDEAAEFGATTTQFGVLTILSSRAGVDQISLAKLVGLDRSTTALVVTKLEADGLLERRLDPRDRRRRELVLTSAGRRLLRKLEAPARRAQERALSVFEPGESAEFLRLLEKFVTTFNEVTRAPIMAPQPRSASAVKARGRAGKGAKRRGPLRGG